MAITLEFTEQVFAISGTFPAPYNKTRLYEVIQEAGGKISKSVSQRTTVLVVGKRQMDWFKSQEENKAIQRGLPILTADQFFDFMEGGTITLSESVEASVSLEQLIGEARAVLDGEPTSETWTTLVALLDQCDPDYTEPFVSYLKRACSTWRVHPESQYTQKKAWDRHTTSWLKSAPFGILRVAPRHWLTEASLGQQHPKYTLARAVMSSGLGMSNKSLIQILEHESFSQIESLDLGRTKPQRSASVYKALRDSPMAASLTHLRINQLKHDQFKSVTMDGALSPHTLRMYYKRFEMSPQSLIELMESGWCAQVETLILEGGSFSQDVNWFHLHSPESLRRGRVVLDRSMWSVASVMASLPEVEVLSVCGVCEMLGRLDTPRFHNTSLQGASTLDLSGVVLSNESRRAEAQSIIFDPLPESRVCSTIKAIRLGQWATPELIEAFTRAHIEVLDIEG